MHGIKRKQWTQELLKQKRIQDKKKIEGYRELVTAVLDLKDRQIYTIEAFKETTKVLQDNPEYNVAWNFRRDIITHLKDQVDIQFWNRELLFTLAQLKRYPKVYWIWNHRLWLLENHADASIAIWNDELSMVDKLLGMDARNFHGWLYRRMIVSRIEQHTGQKRTAEELAYTTKNINKNISNFSAWHRRAALLPEAFAINNKEENLQFIRAEFSYITNAMFTDAEDQSVWFYIKWFINNKFVRDTLESTEYVKLMQELQNNIMVINQDDLEFSGKQNTWCLKILIVLDDVLKKMNVDTDIDKKKYLGHLIEADPLRKRRYVYLLNTMQ